MQYYIENILVGQQDALHFGAKGHSGRYPLGSGDRPYQDYPNMRARQLKKEYHNANESSKKIKRAALESAAASGVLSTIAGGPISGAIGATAGALTSIGINKFRMNRAANKYVKKVLETEIGDKKVTDIDTKNVKDIDELLKTENDNQKKYSGADFFKTSVDKGVEKGIAEYREKNKPKSNRWEQEYVDEAYNRISDSAKIKDLSKMNIEQIEREIWKNSIDIRDTKQREKVINQMRDAMDDYRIRNGYTNKKADYQDVASLIHESDYEVALDDDIHRMIDIEKKNKDNVKERKEAFDQKTLNRANSNIKQLESGKIPDNLKDQQKETGLKDKDFIKLKLEDQKNLKSQAQYNIPWYEKSNTTQTSKEGQKYFEKEMNKKFEKDWTDKKDKYSWKDEEKEQLRRGYLHDDLGQDYWDEIEENWQKKQKK